MTLLNEIVKSENGYLDQLAQIAEQIDIWLKDISKEKRLGLKPMDQMLAELPDPYNNTGPDIHSDDTVEFKPTSGVGAPKPDKLNNELSRIHLIYNPSSGEIEKTLKTPIRSRPPAEYTEANAGQIQGALKHLEKMNPKLADLLVDGRMNVWIPRTAAKSEPSSVKHLGLSTNSNIESKGNTNIAKMSPAQMAKMHAAANRMKTG